MVGWRAPSREDAEKAAEMLASVVREVTEATTEAEYATWKRRLQFAVRALLELTD